MNRIKTLKVPLAGVQQTSLIDYPGGEIASVLFIGGCNFRCGYCQNPSLIKPPDKWVSIGKILDELYARKRMIKSVVISGGEPLLYDVTLKLIELLVENGYNVKLDTNGNFPGRLEYLLNNDLIKYLAMDLKTIYRRYYEFSFLGAEKNIESSISLLLMNLEKSSRFEFRTTLCPVFVSLEELREMATYINKHEIRWIWQQYRPTIVLNPVYKKVQPYQDETINNFLNEIQSNFLGEIQVRGMN